MHGTADQLLAERIFQTIYCSGPFSRGAASLPSGGGAVSRHVARPLVSMAIEISPHTAMRTPRWRPSCSLSVVSSVASSPCPTWLV
jgi:hypothetical protein